MTSAKSNSARSHAALDIAYIAVFAALIAVLGFVAIPVGVAAVPIVLQNAAVILAGLVLGARRGFLATGLFLLVGLIFPVLAGGRTTIHALGSPTVGYLVGYLISAVVAGAIAYRAPWTNKTAAVGLLALAGFLALFIQYACGSLGLMWRADLSFGAAFASQSPFLIPDTVKLVVIIAIALAVHSALPTIRRR